MSLDQSTGKPEWHERERESYGLLERCGVLSFPHPSWAVDSTASAAGQRVVTATVGHAC